jgi:hypothetical protein
LSAGGTGSDDMRQFNYYAGGGGPPNLEEFTEQDILKLEAEVEELLRNRFKEQGHQQDPNVVNIAAADAFRVAKSAQVGVRPHKQGNLI